MGSDVELKPTVDRAPSLVSERQRQGEWRTYTNVVVICLASSLQFIAFSAITNLRSSLSTETNVAANSLSIIYGCPLLSTAFLLHPSIAIFGLKWAMVISQIPYVFIDLTKIDFAVSIHLE